MFFMKETTLLQLPERKITPPPETESVSASLQKQLRHECFAVEATC